MRTRIFNKMLAQEVEDYLARGGNTIYVAVGVTEVHGALPIDCETIMPEGFALEMAEQSDGLAMINLPYFFPGGTIISNATVQVSVEDSIKYLKMITRSLIAQGFRKIIYISGHGPATLYIDATCRDIFQETKVHVTHINLMSIMMNFTPKEAQGFEGMNKLMYGCYAKMHQEVFLPVDPDAVEIRRPKTDPNSALNRLGAVLQKVGSRPSIYFGSLEEHGGGKPFASEEERHAACEEGLRLLHDTVAKIPLTELQTALDDYAVYVQKVCEKFPRITK